ncbi:MAG: PilZ domain-containing protein [Candidatus Baltobacteraceae bacterium]
MSTDDNGAQQRRFYRASVNFPVTIAVTGEARIILGNAVDLSGGGVRVETRSDLAKGGQLTLRFKLSESSAEMAVRGHMVLSFYDGSKQQFAHGIAFTQISPADQEAIVHFIHELQRRGIKDNR